jgi:hypothetical protein
LVRLFFQTGLSKKLEMSAFLIFFSVIKNRFFLLELV